jgi:WhiB family redox-sensing transcriptional regulator
VTGYPDETLDDLLRSEADWFERAACRGATAVMFPPWGGSAKRARRICAECPVRSECLEYAVSLPASPPCGVWAGLTERQLRRVRNERNTAA